MAFVTDKEEIKPGLIIFRRSDVAHRNWYCRVKLPCADRYKTVSLKTSDVGVARHLAGEQEVEVRAMLKHGVAVFNHPFRAVAKEYLATQQARAKRGEISKERPKKLKAVIEGALEEYVGSTQVHRIGDELWASYPAWRRENGAGRNRRNGVREVSAEQAAGLDARDTASRARAMAARGFTKLRPKAAAPAVARTVALISDSTIRFEMSIFGAVMNYAIKKRYVSASQRFDDRPKLKTMRRDEFTLEEYRHLHTVARSWVKQAIRPSSTWYRTVAYNFILIMCNTGMRPSEAKNLRWRDVTTGADRDGRELVVLFVQGKGKSRKLVAPKSVGDYLERIRDATRAYRQESAKEGEAVPDAVFPPEARVFTTVTGEPASTLYKAMIEDLLVKAKLREGASGVPRSTYCFRHTYATFRLAEGVDVYFLAEQMGTSVKMIEEHYGHVNTVKHADLVLQGMGGWDVIDPAAQELAARSGGDPAASTVEGRAKRRARDKAPPRPTRRTEH